jgi:hypothetical protein
MRATATVAGSRDGAISWFSPLRAADIAAGFGVGAGASATPGNESRRTAPGWISQLLPVSLLIGLCWPAADCMSRTPASPSSPPAAKDLFTGPINDLLLEAPLDAAPIDEVRIGLTARWRYDREQVLAFLRETEIRWLRLNFHDYAPEVIELARKAGMKVLLQPGGVPVDSMAPEQLAEFYVDRIVSIVEGNLDVIAAVQIFNEPMNFPRTVTASGKRTSLWIARYGGTWYGGGYVDPFGRFSALVAEALREHFPELTLVGGTKFVGSTLQVIQDHHPSLDGIYLQPYPRKWPAELLPFANDPLARDTTTNWRVGAAVEQILERTRQVAGNPDLGLWVTEIGATTFEPRHPGGRENQPPVDEAFQARLYARLWAAYMDSPIERVFFYELNDMRQSALPHEPNRNFAVVAPGWRPKPAWFVLARLNRLTGGAPRSNRSLEVSVDVRAEADQARRVAVGSWRHGGRVTYREGVVSAAFTSPRVSPLVMVWRDGTTAGGPQAGPPWPTRVHLPAAVFGCGVIAIDVLTGVSERLAITSGADRIALDIEVPDYPVTLVPARQRC